jgi:hypothetical protein
LNEYAINSQVVTKDVPRNASISDAAQVAQEAHQPCLRRGQAADINVAELGTYSNKDLLERLHKGAEADGAVVHGEEQLGQRVVVRGAAPQVLFLVQEGEVSVQGEIEDHRTKQEAEWATESALAGVVGEELVNALELRQEFAGRVARGEILEETQRLGDDTRLAAPAL